MFSSCLHTYTKKNYVTKKKNDNGPQPGLKCPNPVLGDVLTRGKSIVGGQTPRGPSESEDWSIDIKTQGVRKGVQTTNLPY